MPGGSPDTIVKDPFKWFDLSKVTWDVDTLSANTLREFKVDIEPLYPPRLTLSGLKNDT